MNCFLNSLVASKQRIPVLCIRRTNLSRSALVVYACFLPMLIPQIASGCGNLANCPVPADEICAFLSYTGLQPGSITYQWCSSAFFTRQVGHRAFTHVVGLQ